MRVFILWLILAAPLISSGCQSSPTADVDSVKANTDNPVTAADDQCAVMWVKGMGCPGCAFQLEKQLLAVDGVQRVVVDLGTGRVEVFGSTGPDAPTDRDLTEAVERSGFTLDRITRP
jgi:mercuric ion binding protein